MSGEVEPRIDEEVSAEEREVVLRGLLAFNEAHIGPADLRPVELVARDASGAVIGGLLGNTKWGWLYVDKLWVGVRTSSAAVLRAARLSRLRHPRGFSRRHEAVLRVQAVLGERSRAVSSGRRVATRGWRSGDMRSSCTIRRRAKAPRRCAPGL